MIIKFFCFCGRHSLFIYLEDNNLESAAYKDMLKFEVKGIKVHLLRGDIDEAIDRINRKHYRYI